MSETSELVAEFSRTPCDLTPRDLTPDHVVIVPHDHSREAGWARARYLLSTGPSKGVRLVANGATFECEWPDWARTSPGLVVTELGALRARSVLESLEPLSDAIERRLDRLFDGLYALKRPSRAFFNEATSRLFRRPFEAQPYVHSIVEVFRGQTLHFTADCALAEILESRGEHGLRIEVDGQRAPAVRPWRKKVAFVASTAAFATASVAEQFRVFYESRHSRREIDAIAGARPSRAPDIWILILPTWPRFNKNIIKRVAGPWLDEGGTAGVIMFADIRRGERDEGTLGLSAKNELWPGLRPLDGRQILQHVEQAVVASDVGTFAKTLATSIGRTARLTARILREPTVTFGEHRYDLLSRASDLAKFVTVDVFRASATEQAGRAFIARNQMKESRVVFSTTVSGGTSMLNVLLQDAGASTFEYMHGCCSELRDGETWLKSFTSRRIVWAKPDAETVRALGQECIIAGAPRPDGLHRRARSARPRNILLASNYAHRDSVVGNVLPFEAMQDGLLSLASLLRREFPDVTVRWRPHPADGEASVRRSAKLFPSVQISRDPLADDFEWAEIVVSSASSLVYEALFVGVPVFIHDRPDIIGSPATSFVDPSRRFFWPEEGVVRLGACIRQIENNDPTVAHAEMRALEALFGPTREPISVFEGIRSASLGASSNRYARDAYSRVVL